MKKIKSARTPRYIPFYKWFEIYKSRFQTQIDNTPITVNSLYTSSYQGLGFSSTINQNRSQTLSSRVLQKTERQSVQISYPSKIRIDCFVKYSPDLKDVWLEPKKPNLASIVMDACNLKDEINLCDIPHLRIYHSPKNNDFLREWFRV